MRKWIIAIFVVALVFALGGLRTTLSSAQDKPKKVLPPPPPHILDEVIKKAGLNIPRIEDVPEEAINPKIKDSGIPKDKGKEIVENGKVPDEWETLSDRDYEKEVIKILRGAELTDAELEKLIEPAFVPAPEGTKPIANGWIVTFNKHVKLPDFDKEVKRIIDTYGGKDLNSKNNTLPYFLSFGIETDAGRARAISEDPKVRRVRQDFADKRPGSYIQLGEIRNPLPATKPKDQR